MGRAHVWAPAVPVKRRTPKVRARTLPRQLHALAQRVSALSEAHMAAISGSDGSFYEDGRHEELVTLLPIINQALGIRPWEDGDVIIREVLAAIEHA